MKPRIFVSSTFYDLKYIREDLSNFIKAHDFDPIMFEDGDIGYTPGKSLDQSCYDTMKSSDMVILIIGGLYGSAATGEVKEKFKDYMSVTRKEFRTAVSDGIPVFVFIDSKVYSEYAVYEMNMKAIEEGKINIRFSVTKDINVFRFIKEIKNIGKISITEFSKLIQIKEFLSKQWSDMFKKYLELLKVNKSDEKIKDAVDQMNLLVQKMDIMLDSVGKKILSTSNEYENVIERQKIVEIGKKISGGIRFTDISRMDLKGKREKNVTKVLDILNHCIMKYDKKSAMDLYMEFHRQGLELVYCNIEILDDIKDLEQILENSKQKELLVAELIKDEYYSGMIARHHVGDGIVREYCLPYDEGDEFS